MKRKGFLALTAASTLLLGSLCGCNLSNVNVDQNSQPQEEITPQVVEIPQEELELKVDENGQIRLF